MIRHQARNSLCEKVYHLLIPVEHTDSCAPMWQRHSWHPWERRSSLCCRSRYGDRHGQHPRIKDYTVHRKQKWGWSQKAETSEEKQCRCQWLCLCVKSLGEVHLFMKTTLIILTVTWHNLESSVKTVSTEQLSGSGWTMGRSVWDCLDC